jgi:hypothetical protein
MQVSPGRPRKDASSLPVRTAYVRMDKYEHRAHTIPFSQPGHGGTAYVNIVPQFCR